MVTNRRVADVGGGIAAQLALVLQLPVTDLASQGGGGRVPRVLAAKGIDPNAIQSVRQAYAENRGVDAAAAMTPDDAVDRLIIAGTAAQCLDRLRELFSLAARHGFTEIVIGVPLGPDVPEAIDLWGNEILPALK